MTIDVCACSIRGFTKDLANRFRFMNGRQFNSPLAGESSLSITNAKIYSPIQFLSVGESGLFTLICAIILRNRLHSPAKNQ